MKVLFLYNESEIEGKGNIDLFSLKRELQKLGYKSLLVVRKESGILTKNDVFPILPKPMKAFFTLPILIVKLSRILAMEKPDVIIAEGGWYIPTLLNAANRTKIPVVYNFRGLVLESLISFHVKSLLIKAVAKIFVKINYSILKKSKYLIGTNPALCKFYSEKLKNHVEGIGTHFLDLEKFKPISKNETIQIRNEFGIAKNKVAILYSGAIENWHIKYLIDFVDSVFQLVKEGVKIQFVLMGWGSKHNKFVEFLKKKESLMNGKETVVIVPWLEHEDVPKVIAACDICVDPFLRPYPMNFPPAGKLMEYMACGRCSITTKGDSNEELITNNENGFIVDGSKNQFLITLRKIVTEKNLIEKIGSRARDTILNQQKELNNIHNFEKFLEKIIKK